VNATPVDPLARHAADRPHQPAAVMAASGRSIDWHTLESRSRRIASRLIEAGLKTGDGIAILAENRLEWFEWMWAARRAGLYYTGLSTHWKADEVAYVLRDCGAKALFATGATVAVAAGAPAPPGMLRLLVDGVAPGFEDHEAWLAPAATDAALPARLEGSDFLYSSGTTGRPKGIRRPLEQLASVDLQRGDLAWKRFDARTVYLSTAPMYHSAPVRWTMQVLRAGGCCVVMERFDAEAALQAIERWRVTHAQWVPTMFVRLLRLPAEVRARYDLSSMAFAIHAAAPCPVDVKRAMIDWWGPILHEYYGGTELNGLTYVGPEEWLAHPGTVGRAVIGTIRICHEDGTELPTGEAGIVYFERDEAPFQYHKDPEKTRSAQHPKHPGWTALGDVGHLDEEGFLYLTDRASFMIISGGVNIYPQEIENELIMHPKVEDVAVIGVPNSEFGEEVKAIVQPAAGVSADAALAEELIAYARGRLAAYKCPRSIDFDSDLPRLPTGKLYKRLLKDRYWGRGDSKIVQD